MSRIHRTGLLFKWITKNHEIILGFKKTSHSTCAICGKRIPAGGNICDKCFEKEKKVSKK